MARTAVMPRCCVRFWGRIKSGLLSPSRTGLLPRSLPINSRDRPLRAARDPTGRVNDLIVMADGDRHPGGRLLLRLGDREGDLVAVDVIDGDQLLPVR